MMETDKKAQKTWCIIPVYNNASTVKEVALECRRHLQNVLVVDDGSTDACLRDLFEDTDIAVHTHTKNRGKGAALQSGFKCAMSEGADYAITIDGDGQHHPGDIPQFLTELDENTILIGRRKDTDKVMPMRSRFGRNFSDFWVWIETGKPVSDTQSGYRAYPLKHVVRLPANYKHYDFEIEVLVRSAWAGLEIKSVPVRISYSEMALKMSGFRPVIDNLRISRTHMRLIGRRMLPWPFKRLVKQDISTFDFFKHPLTVLKKLLSENASPRGLAASAWTGIFLGTLPLIGLHMITVLFVSMRLRLNRIMALSVQNICMPPIVPGICITVGYFLRNGQFITHASIKELGSEPLQRLLDWIAGSLAVAPVLASIVSLVIFSSAKILQSRLTASTSPAESGAAKS